MATSSPCAAASMQKAAQDRHKLAPVTKKIRQLEVLIAQLEGQLKEVENQLSDETIYKDDKKRVLTDALENQADIKQQLKNCEEQWLESQEQLESNITEL